MNCVDLKKKISILSAKTEYKTRVLYTEQIFGITCIRKKGNSKEISYELGHIEFSHANTHISACEPSKSPKK